MACRADFLFSSLTDFSSESVFEDECRKEQLLSAGQLMVWVDEAVGIPQN